MFFSGKKQEKNLLQEVCQVQADLAKSEVELETIRKILERIKSCKEQLDQQLEVKIEVLSYK